MVALHRYLRWRLPGYDPEKHLGGAVYLFVRGMAGPGAPTVEGRTCGVFSWRPPSELVVELSDLLAGTLSGSMPMALDQLDAQSVLGLPPDGLLAQFNRAGVLVAADVHVASMLARLGRDGDELVALAAALAVRAPRVGHVLADLATVRETATADAEDEADLSGLPWPALELWAEHVASSPAVSVGDAGPDDRPLRLVGTGLYLDRYWRDEVSVAGDLVARSSAEPFSAEEALLSDGLARLFPDDWEASSVRLPRSPSVATSASSPGGRARARRPPSLACWHSSRSRPRSAAGLCCGWRSQPRPAKRRPGWPKRSMRRAASSTWATRCEPGF